jgi:hypothetical protein
MKLPTLRNTASALEKAKADLAACDTRLAELARQREAALAADDTDPVLAIDHQAEQERRRLGLLQDRAALLADRLASEQASQREADYKAAIVKLEGPLGARSQKAAKIERIAAELAAAVREFEESDSAVAQAWPSGVAWSERVYLPGYLGTSWVGSRFGDVLGADLVDHRTRRAPTASEWFSRLSRLHVSGIGEAAAEQGRAVLEDLRHAHDPQPVQVQTTEDEAA